MGFKLQFQRAGQPAFLQLVGPPLVHEADQRAANGCCLFFAMCAFEPDEGGVSIAVNHVIALRLNQRPGLAHDRVAAHGDR